MNTPVGRLGAAVEAAASNQTPEQKRQQIARIDRMRWGSGRHASGAYGIISPRGEVISESKDEKHRDTLLAVVRSEFAGAAMVERLLAEIKSPGASATAVACLVQDAEAFLAKRP